MTNNSKISHAGSGPDCQGFKIQTALFVIYFFKFNFAFK